MRSELNGDLVSLSMAVYTYILLLYGIEPVIRSNVRNASVSSISEKCLNVKPRGLRVKHLKALMYGLSVAGDKAAKISFSWTSD